MLRRSALLGFLGAAAAAQDVRRAEAARRLALDASRALQAGEAPRFIGYFDRRRTPQIERLRENVAALCAQSAIASSVDIRVEEESAEAVRLSVDWLLQLTPIEDVGAVERRQAVLRVDVGESRGRPRIVLLEPVDFFRPAPPR
jgi:hypothetical protein